MSWKLLAQLACLMFFGFTLATLFAAILIGIYQRGFKQ